MLAILYFVYDILAIKFQIKDGSRSFTRIQEKMGNS